MEDGAAVTKQKKAFTVRYDSIQNYLDDILEHRAWWMYSFVAKNGRVFGKRQPLPKGCERGEPQRCFWNAYLLSSLRPELIYVEGFARRTGATRDLITHHAWTVDEKGYVYDPTWNGVEYFGVPFRPDYVRATMTRILPECTSLLDNSVENFPLKRAKSPKSWLQTMPPPARLLRGIRHWSVAR